MLYIVATPIGNLKDISFRAIETLSGVDLILCEDTRVTKKLLDHFNIKTPTLSYHQHSKLKKIEIIIDKLKNGENIALVSDAGTPGISDPGNMLIEKIIEAELSTDIVPIPGPSAITTIASACNFSMDKFIFLGFPPVKNKRKKYFEEVIESKYPVIFYESTHRIIKSLEELSALDQNLNIVVGRELTKKFETIYRGKITDVIDQIQKDSTKGEFVVVIQLLENNHKNLT